MSDPLCGELKKTKKSLNRICFKSLLATNWYDGGGIDACYWFQWYSIYPATIVVYEVSVNEQSSAEPSKLMVKLYCQHEEKWYLTNIE